MRSVTRTALIAGMAAVLATGPGAHAYPRPGSLERVGPLLDADGVPPVMSIVGVSTDHRTLLLYTRSPLIPSDTMTHYDLYVLDRTTGSIERVCRSVNGGEANGHCHEGRLSADGRFVSFTSDATNLVASDANGPVTDVFVWSRETKAIELASVSGTEVQADEGSSWSAISADGRHVAFSSFSEVLSPDDRLPWADIFVRDRAAGTTELITVSTEEVQGSTNAMFPVISGDGRSVAYVSVHPYDRRDTNPFMDVYVRDRVLGVTEWISSGTDGSPGNGQSTYPAISHDGRIVAFASGAGNLVPADDMAGFDTFVRDRQTGRLERIVASNGVQPADVTSSPFVSPDGRYVGVHTLATNLGYDDPNGRTTDPYVYDRLERTLELLSVTPSGTTGNNFSSGSLFGVGPDGSRMATLFSNATDLIEGEEAEPGSSYLRHLGPELGVGRLDLDVRDGRVEVAGAVRFPGATVSAAEDRPDDAARVIGADITAASVRYRPEEGDVLVEIDLSALRPHIGPTLVGTSGREPGALVYGVAFDGCLPMDGGGPVCGRHEVRATEEPDADGPSFGLFRCETTCSRVAELTGGIGTAGDVVLISVPAAMLGGEGAALGMRNAFVRATAEGPGPLRMIDEAALAAGTLAATTLEVGIAPPGTPAAEVAFQAVPVTNGRFAADLDRGSGPRRVWTRACIGSTCRTQDAPLS